jgi:hypothetical protein
MTSAYSQEVIVLKGDTVVTLEKKSIETLNEIALHRKYLIEELRLCDFASMVKDSILDSREKEIEKYKLMSNTINAKIELYDDKIHQLEKEIKKKERNNGLILGGGILSFILSILFL